MFASACQLWVLYAITCKCPILWKLYEQVAERMTAPSLHRYVAHMSICKLAHVSWPAIFKLGDCGSPMMLCLYRTSFSGMQLAHMNQKKVPQWKHECACATKWHCNHCCGLRLLHYNTLLTPQHCRILPGNINTRFVCSISLCVHHSSFMLDMKDLSASKHVHQPQNPLM